MLSITCTAPMEGVPPPTAQSVDEEPEHQKVEVPLGGNVQLTCPKGKPFCSMLSMTLQIPERLDSETQ